MMDTREPHWVKLNHQERMPPRMIAFDTESKMEYQDEVEVQSFRTCAAIRWRTDLGSGDGREGAVFNTPEELWAWITSYCRPETRTVVWAHNLGHDIRISQAFTMLPYLGFELEWCNLDRNVSSMTWRSERGTLVFADTWTWIPLPLNVIAPMVGMVKFAMPKKNATAAEWNYYCRNDAEVVYHVVTDLCQFIRDEHLGNWQPTGAGMSYAAWRHRFMAEKVLVHNDPGAIEAERAAMHTGRAEAWRHGSCSFDKWTEVDLKNAYLTIAAECELPRKLHMHTKSLSLSQYRKLTERFAVLCRCDIDTDMPVLPTMADGRHLWPVGQFAGWYWDTEVNNALRYGASIKIREAYVYARSPVLREWATWIRERLQSDLRLCSPVVATHLKHCSRALIGRLSLRTPNWEQWGDNPEGITGISHVVFPETGRVQRMMHVGDRTLIETDRKEGKDSLPQITGWIMAECRVRLWEAMTTAGLDHLAHVDTDSVLVDQAGLARLREHWGERFAAYWTLKGTYTRLTVLGPRSYWRDGDRVAAGIPRKAIQAPDGSFTGERWASLSHDLETASGNVVTVRPGTWHMRQSDPRRQDAPGIAGATIAYMVTASSANGSSSESTPRTGLCGSVTTENFGSGPSFPSSLTGNLGSSALIMSTLPEEWASLMRPVCALAASIFVNAAIGHCMVAFPFLTRANRTIVFVLRMRWILPMMRRDLLRTQTLRHHGMVCNRFARYDLIRR